MTTNVTVAFVNTQTGEVLDIQALLPNRIPDDPEGFRYLAQGRDWAVDTAPPRIGMVWQQNLPASFIEAPAPDGGNLASLSIAELQDLQRAKLGEALEIQDAIDVQLRGG